MGSRRGKDGRKEIFVRCFQEKKSGPDKGKNLQGKPPPSFWEKVKRRNG